MNVILGKRDYEETGTGKYPKYNLHQMNLYVLPDCPQYTGIQVICNKKSYDIFEKYADELSKEEKLILDEKIKQEYGIHNVNIDDFIDWARYEYKEDEMRFFDKLEAGRKVLQDAKKELEKLI